MMSGLDRIIEKINADSLASCREIADQAQKKAQDIAEDANAHAEKAYSDIIADAEKKAQSILNMSEANTRLCPQSGALGESRGSRRGDRGGL